MDGSRFDLLARTIGRRGLLAAVLGLVAGRPVWRPAAAGLGIPPCAGRGAGARCRRGGQCCSGACNKKRGKRKGRCRCSAVRQPCRRDADCCGRRGGNPLGPVCGQQLGAPGATVCCRPVGAGCGAGADCCGTQVCNAAGACELAT